MKLVFLTNEPSYYQVEFAEAMVKQLGEDNFRLVFHHQNSAVRSEMGWDDNYTQNYIIRFWHSEDEKTRAYDWIDHADVVIQGRFPVGAIRKRVRASKLTYVCQERLWKKPPSWHRKLSRLPHLIKNYFSINKQNTHFLAIGTGAASDLNQLGLFSNRSWRFGYFINCAPSSKLALDGNAAKNTKLNLLWCARFTEMKQPSVALKILQTLKQANMDAHLTMVGDGELRPAIESEISKNKLDEFVTMTGWQNSEQIEQHMRDANLYLMTSHRGEGWGLVVNEAMSQGCCVLANQHPGSAAWLIEHQQTGFLYQNSNLDDVLKQIIDAGTNTIIQMGARAHQKMNSEWSADIAASRLIELSKKLLNNDKSGAIGLYKTGVCSYIDNQHD